MWLCSFTIQAFLKYHSRVCAKQICQFSLGRSAAALSLRYVMAIQLGNSVEERVEKGV